MFRAVKLLYVLLATVACFAASTLNHGAAAAAPSCKVTSGLKITFGTYDVLGGAVSTTGSVTGTCKKATSSPFPISITIDGGNNLQSNGNRAMACKSGQCSTSYPSDLLQYQLYTNATLTTVWTANTVSVNTACSGCTGTTNTAFTAVPIYAQIPAAVAGGVNDTAVGTYSDAITITINY